MKRIEWIDTAKFLGIFFIYLGHLADVAGLAYGWVFSFHVPLFFFLSGCLECNNKRNLVENIKHKAITILIPFFFFGLLSIIFDALNTNTFINTPNNLAILIDGGVRGKINLGGSLWFFTCLFIVEVIFSVLKKIPYRSVILVICLSLYLAAELLFDPKPISSPQWYYNLDSACYYIIFYGIGWSFYERLNSILTMRKGKFFLIMSVMYSSILFGGTDIFIDIWSINSVFTALGGILRPMISIFMVVYVSSYLSKNELMKEIGRNTLYLCGNEYLIKSIIPLSVSMIGLTLTIETPLQAYLYTFFLLVITNKTLVVLEKPILKKIQNICTIKKE